MALKLVSVYDAQLKFEYLTLPSFFCRAQCTSENRSVLVYDNWTTCSLDDDQRRGVYGALIVSLIGFNLLRAVMCYAICVNASRVLHNRMFSSVMRVPVLFFDTNPIGKCLITTNLVDVH